MLSQAEIMLREKVGKLRPLQQCTTCMAYVLIDMLISHSQLHVIKKCLTSLFQARSQNCHKRLLASSYPSVYSSVRMEQLGFHLVNFYEILF